MKPIILYADETDKVTITKAKLDSLIEEAYRQGIADGERAVTYSWIVPTQPVNPYEPWITYKPSSADYVPRFVTTLEGIS